MSNIYILEPPTNGKICLKTTVGDIDVELWSKECPRACRNFVQLCLEGYYNGTIFHRVVPDFIVQGGDPVGTGEGGESVYGSPFKDEFHQRLKFTRRGLLAMANGGPNGNGSQFFFTLSACPELDRKHSIFGKVEGDTLYNMLKLAEGEIDDDERPVYPQKIICCEVLKNPFPDIVPRCLPSEIRKKKTDTKEKSKSQSRAIQSYKLLSFGDEAEAEEEFARDRSTNDSRHKKSKSAHDLTADKTLSSQPAIGEEDLYQHSTAVKQEGNDEAENDKQLEHVRSKLTSKSGYGSKVTTESHPKAESTSHVDDEVDDGDYSLWKDERKEQKAKLDAVKEEVREMKKELRKNTQREEEIQVEDKPHVNPALRSYFDERGKYAQKSDTIALPKSANRENDTLSMIAKFKERLSGARAKLDDGADDENNLSGDDHHPDASNAVSVSAVSKAGDRTTANMDDRGTSATGVSLTEAELDAEDIGDDDWLAHTFKARKAELNVVRDASIKSDENFDIYDPRNAMNKRRREAAKQDARDGKRRKN